MHVVVIGPPDSGKSTFTAALYEALQDISSDRPESVAYAPLDLWDNSGPWLLDDTGDVPQKKDPDDDEAAKEEHLETFLSKSADVVVADTPGEIDQVFRDLIAPADESVLLISEENLDEKNKWVSECKKVGVPLLQQFISYHHEADTDTNVDLIEPNFDPGEMGVVKNLSNEAYKLHRIGGLNKGTETTIRMFADYLIQIS
jgi:hypothetical protein